MGSVLIIALQSKLLIDYYQTKKKRKKNNIFEPRTKEKRKKRIKTKGNFYEQLGDIT